MEKEEKINKQKNFVGMSMNGGRRDNFYFCLIGYFEEEKRWFLHSILKAADEKLIEWNDDVIRSWMQKNHVENLIVDLPLTRPVCHSCNLYCPGMELCPLPEIREIEEISIKLLNNDLEKVNNDPKNYERERREGKMLFSEEEPPLSRALKRKLKKGFLPYWNRPLDLWVWIHYHDLLLKFFNFSYDSMGTTSLMALSRFSYVCRHFSSHLNLFEGNVFIILLELLRANIINEFDIQDLKGFEEAYDGRKKILKKIETSLNIFIYDQDLNIIAENPKAFESFLLAISGKNIVENNVIDLPHWTLPKETSFIVPHYLS